MRTSQVTIRLLNGSRDVPCTVYGAFAVHRRVKADGGAWPGWTLTHIQSGLAVPPMGIRTRARALRFARQLTGLPIDWHKPNPFSGVKAGLKARAQVIASRLSYER